MFRRAAAVVSNDFDVDAKLAGHRSAFLAQRARSRCRGWAAAGRQRGWCHRKRESSGPLAEETMKAYDYKILKAKNTDELSKDVAKTLAEGWQPLGPPFTLAEGVAQALVKYEE
jgi:hypothetical protein